MDKIQLYDLERRWKAVEIVLLAIAIVILAIKVR